MNKRRHETTIYHKHHLQVLGNSCKSRYAG